MALKITNNAGILELYGSLNEKNIVSFRNHFELLINNSSFIILSLNNLIELDKTAFQAIIGLYKKALSKNKVFYIIGNENQKVVDIFEAEKCNYLLINRAT